MDDDDDDDDDDEDDEAGWLVSMADACRALAATEAGANVTAFCAAFFTLGTILLCCGGGATLAATAGDPAGALDGSDGGAAAAGATNGAAAGATNGAADDAADGAPVGGADGASEMGDFVTLSTDFSSMVTTAAGDAFPAADAFFFDEDNGLLKNLNSFI